MKKGFTLIELLVVVLIIGILASIALPQYQKAVNKARLAEAKVTLSALMRASEAALLADPNYNGDMSTLDIEVQDSKYWHYENEGCSNANGYRGCSWSAYMEGEGGSIDIIIHMSSEGYFRASEIQGPDGTYAAALYCTDGTVNQCSKYGFINHDEADGWWY